MKNFLIRFFGGLLSWLTNYIFHCRCKKGELTLKAIDEINSKLKEGEYKLEFDEKSKEYILVKKK